MTIARSKVAFFRNLYPWVGSHLHSDAVWLELYEGHLRALLIEESENESILRAEHLSGAWNLLKSGSIKDGARTVAVILRWAKSDVALARDVLRYAGSDDMDDARWLSALSLYLLDFFARAHAGGGEAYLRV